MRSLLKHPSCTELCATSTEFSRVFQENMDSMHLLSFLLTADLTKAEECFVSGLEDCVKGSYVFRDWARSWARRTIIQNAVRMLAPRANHSTVTVTPRDPADCRFGRTQDADAAIASILALEEFERFVFVLSVLERYSDQDCFVLLGCSRQDVREARIRALQHVAESDRMHTVARSGAATLLRSYHSKRWWPALNDRWSLVNAWRYGRRTSTCSRSNAGRLLL